MLLAIDIGNTSTKFGVFDNDSLTVKLSIPTKRKYDATDIAEALGSRLDTAIDTAIGCSVVPEANAAVTEYLLRNLNLTMRFVKSTDNFRLSIDFPVDSFGTDRLVNSYAAAEKYGSPVIVVSLGTATTIDVVDAERRYCGGLIAAGMRTSAKALSRNAAQLPEVAVEKPERLIATTTDSAIRSGVFYGHIAMLEGLLRRVKSEMPAATPVVVATGGFAELLSPEIKDIEIVDTNLTLDGLRMIGERRD
jgi:type III pantothenate kinase